MGNWKWRIWRCRAAISSCSESCGQHGRAGVGGGRGPAAWRALLFLEALMYPGGQPPPWSWTPDGLTPLPTHCTQIPQRGLALGSGGDRRVGCKVAACAHLVRQTAGLMPRASGSRGGRVGPCGPLPVGGPLRPALGEDSGVCGPAPRSQRDETQPWT